MKKGMKAKFMKLVAAVLVASMIICLFPAMNLQAKTGDFEADLQIGYGNSAEIGKYVPFQITVENKTKDFNGNIQMIIPMGSNENYMYEQNVSIPAGAKKTVTFVLPVYSTYGKTKIRLTNERGKVIWDTEKRFSVLNKITDVNVGILSNDYSALSYMDRLPFTGNGQYVTRIFEMDINSFSSDWHALDMLDVIVISDFSTDLFTDSQIRALTMWVNNGGLLMVGTGSTSSKTLSGLNHKMFEVTPEKLHTKETKLGLPYRQFSYSYSNNNFNNYNYNDPYNDPDFVEEFEEDFENNPDSYAETFRQDFENEWWGGPMEDEYWQEDWVQDEFKRFCMERIYKEYVKSLANPGDSAVSQIEEGSSISVSVLQMTADKANDVIVGDDIYGGVYDLHHIFNVGNGYIVLSGIDYTKNPIPGYEFSSLFFLDLVESLIGKKIDEEYQNSQYSYSNNSKGLTWQEGSYLNNVSDAPIPPGFLYMGLLLVFQGLLIAMFFILGHKKKSFKLWFWYPVLAIGATLLVYCLGFSTRLLRPRLKVDSVITVGDNIITEKGFAAFTVPRNKKYNLSISSQYQVRQDVKDNYYYGSSSANDIDLDKYTRSFNVSSNFCEFQIQDIEPLGTEKMILETIDYTDKDIVIETNKNDLSYTIDAEEIAITNKMGIDLEDVLVMVYDTDYKCYSLGKIKQGETMKLSQKLAESEQNRYLERSKIVNLSQNDANALLGLIVGSLSPSYRKYRNRARILNHAIDEYDDYYGNQQMAAITVFAFPKKGFDGKIQENSKFREERTEILIKHIEEELYSVRF